MTQTISAIFDQYSDATAAVSALEANGVSNSDISIIANNADGTHRHGVKDGVGEKSDAAADAGIGAGIGATLGGAGGLLAGLGIMAIPGVGPVVAAGWLISTAAGAIAGAVAGGATGGIIGALTGAGVPEDDAHVYAETVRRGGTLVTARVAEADAPRLNALLQQHKSVDVADRRALYQGEGWTAFDADTPSAPHKPIQGAHSAHR